MNSSRKASSNVSNGPAGFSVSTILYWLFGLIILWMCLLVTLYHSGYLHTTPQQDERLKKYKLMAWEYEKTIADRFGHMNVEELSYLLAANSHSAHSAQQRVTPIDVSQDTGDAHEAAAVHVEQLRGGMEHAGKDVHASAAHEKNPKNQDANGKGKSAISKLLERSNPTGAGEVHIVFSTDCSEFQDWQTLVLFHSASVVGQRGSVSRIASGCDDAKKESLNKLYEKVWPDRQYRAHYTPDFKKDSKSGKKYDFYNKPWGVKHWLEFAEPPVQSEVVVALLDPDMILLRPITVEIASLDNAIWSSRLDKREMLPRVVQGRPVAQLYGLGAPWTNDKHPKFNRTRICGEGSPCLQGKERWAAEHFAVGPPYLVHKQDMEKIAATWTSFVPKVYEGYPFLLAEMYAYSMAAAHEKLPHLQGEHYMVSNTDVDPGEGWPHVDALPAGMNELPLGPNGEFFPGRKVPTVVHYCQFFRAGDYGFQKRRVPKNVFTCEGNMMAELPAALDAATYQYKQEGQVPIRGKKQAKRHAFALGVVHRAINAAILDFKTKMCKGQKTSYVKDINVAGKPKDDSGAKKGGK